MPDFGFSLRLGFLLTGHGSLGEFLKKRNMCDDESFELQHVLKSLEMKHLVAGSRIPFDP